MQERAEAETNKDDGTFVNSDRSYIKEIDTKNGARNSKLAEWVMCDIWPDAYKRDKPGEEYTGDIMLDGYVYEVKCHGLDHSPRLHYCGNVPDKHLERDPERYLFSFYNEAKQIIYLVGWIEGAEIKALGDFTEAGELFPLKTGRADVDTWSVPIDKMEPVKDIPGVRPLTDSVILY
jgi:hypothetical protein